MIVSLQGTLGVCKSVSLHEVLNVEVIQSVPRWRRLSGALGHPRRHLRRHFTFVKAAREFITRSYYLRVRALPVLLASLPQGSLASPWASWELLALRASQEQKGGKKKGNKTGVVCVCVCVEATRVVGPSVASNVQTGLRTLLEHTALVVLPC